MGAVRNSRSPPIASVSIFVPDFLYHFRLTELVLVEYIIRQVPFAVILFVYFRFIGFKGAGCKLCEVGSLLTVDHRLLSGAGGVGGAGGVEGPPQPASESATTAAPERVRNSRRFISFMGVLLSVGPPVF